MGDSFRDIQAEKNGGLSGRRSAYVFFVITTGE